MKHLAPFNELFCPFRVAESRTTIHLRKWRAQSNYVILQGALMVSEGAQPPPPPPLPQPQLKMSSTTYQEKK